MNFNLTIKQKLYFVLSVILFSGFLYALPLMRELNLKGLDWFMTGHSPSPDIALIAIDNKSIAELGRWPWDRSVHANLINVLSEYAPRAAGYDVIFSDPSKEADDYLLAQSFSNSGFPIVLAGELIYLKGSEKNPKELVPLKIFADSKNVRVGYVNAQSSYGGIARIIPEKTVFQKKEITSFAYMLAEAAKFSDSFNFKGKHLINFAGPAGTFPTYSASDVIAKKIHPELLKDKIVLIGATASDLHDVLTVPLSNPIMSGVEWHGNVLDNVLTSRTLYFVPEFIPTLIGLLLSLGLLIFAFGATAKKVLVSALALALIFPFSSYLLWQGGVAFIFLSNVLSIVFVFIIFSVLRWYRAEMEKKKLRERFQNYFSPHVLESIIKNPSDLSLGGECREITVFFSDIRSFTTMTEGTDSEVLIKILHRYFTEMSKEIFATDGVLDKFIGDAIMAFWGAPLVQPNHPELAVRAAIGMMRRLKQLKEDFAKEGLPVFDIGIGINTGLATVGNMGSQKRFDYTVIGDCVNLASRLESLNKEYKTHIIISESTEKHLPPDISRRYLGETTVKGKTVPTKIFEVYGY